MAEYKRTDFDGPEGWTLVLLSHPPKSLSPEIQAMRDWLNDPTRPGRWFWWGMAGDDGRSELNVYMTDPAVAFEFKMRWA